MGFQAINDITIEGTLTDENHLKWYAKGRECDATVIMTDAVFNIVEEARREKKYLKVRVRGQLANDYIYCHHIEVA